MRLRVKICGITDLVDARAAVGAGADLLGFVFYRKSPRFISPEKAGAIIRRVPGRFGKVGVFVNAPAAEVEETARACGLDHLQFHGAETPAYLRRFKGRKIIKAVRVKSALSLRRLGRTPADFFLFDAFHRDAFGGTGKTFDWGLLDKLKKVRRPFFVSGGLTPDNVGELLRRIRPYGIDVSSGVELRPGRKSAARIRRFMRQKEKYAGPRTPKKQKGEARGQCAGR